MREARPVTPSDIREIVELFSDVDFSIIADIYYFDGWTDYEESGGLLIFKGIDDSIQRVTYSYCVMDTDHENYFDPEDIQEWEMEQDIAEMESYMENYHE